MTLSLKTCHTFNWWSAINSSIIRNILTQSTCSLLSNISKNDPSLCQLSNAKKTVLISITLLFRERTNILPYSQWKCVWPCRNRFIITIFFFFGVHPLRMTTTSNVKRMNPLLVHICCNLDYYERSPFTHIINEKSTLNFTSFPL